MEIDGLCFLRTNVSCWKHHHAIIAVESDGATTQSGSSPATWQEQQSERKINDGKKTGTNYVGHRGCVRLCKWVVARPVHIEHIPQEQIA
jgi:hypothetical protein